MTGAQVARDRILAIGAVTALVDQRVYAVVAAQSALLPYVRVQLISEIANQQLRGPIGLKVTRVQVDAYGSTLQSAQAVMAAIHGDGLGDTATGLWGWAGSIGSPAVTVHAVEADGIREFFEAPELRMYRVLRDYLLHWSE